MRGGLLWRGLLLLMMSAFASAGLARGNPILRVAYAGSMGVVMDEALGPAFARTHTLRYEGIGQGSYALARLLAAHQMRTDVFVCITPGPMRVLKHAGLVTSAVPIASTQMVVVYSPHSRYAADFERAAHGDMPWYEVLREPGLRFGRTDPAVDPQGASLLLTLQLAAKYYHVAGLMQAIAGPAENPAQIFAEPSLLSRLEAGQIDATIGYLSAAESRHLPSITLPDEINLTDPALQSTWYRRAAVKLADGKALHAQPLVFYAAVPRDAPQPALAQAFIEFLLSVPGQALLHDHGYSAPHGGNL